MLGALTSSALPWELALHLPWQPLQSPLAKWAVQPSFVVGEYLFYGLAIAALVHALRQGEARRRHLLVWIGALLAGTANDLIFMALPLVDNFWQAQATVMLTPRLPLYIPCVYVCFMYYPTVAVSRLGLGGLARAALSGLAASLFYAPYDIVGAKFLWWTWHDSDLPIARRILGAPIGSTMWVITFVAAFAWFLGKVTDRDPAVSRATFARGLLLVCGLSSLTMVLQVTVLQQLDGGVPGPIGLAVVTALYGALALRGLRSARPEPWRPGDRLLLRATWIYFATLAAIMAIFDPATHRSASMHQTYGPCHVEAKDIAGLVRYQYICAEDFDEDFTFDCLDAPPAEGSEWYTVCGRAHSDFPRWMAGVAGLGVAGVVAFSLLLGVRRRRADGSTMGRATRA
ncbi:MAG: hypothetical protein H6711_30785 [Myxococcales bacterium]|nr:hypothetical protein [Myxococcales bacterium]